MAPEGRRPGSLELCCGHAGLSAALWDHGFDATAVDWAGNKHQACMPVINIDLTTDRGQQFIMDLLRRGTILYVHMGPPCGTFTRARERPVPEHLLAQGAPNPRPLRSEECPGGLPDDELSATDRERALSLSLSL